MVIWCWSGGGAGYLLAQEWAALMLSLALAAVRKFMVTELQWLTLYSETVEMFGDTARLLQRYVVPGVPNMTPTHCFLLALEAIKFLCLL